MTIEEFCYAIRRKLVSFEHFIVIKQKIDVHEKKTMKKWYSIMVKWFAEDFKRKM